MKFSKSKNVKITNFEIQKCYIPQKKAENMYNKDSARKVRFLAKNFILFQFFNFFPKARGLLKILTFNFHKFSKTNCKNGFFGTSQVLNGTKS